MEKPGSFVRKLQTSDLLQAIGLQKMKHVYDYVREEQLPEAEDKEFYLLKYFRVRRPLRPERRERKVRQNGEKPLGFCHSKLLLYRLLKLLLGRRHGDCERN